MCRILEVCVDSLVSARAAIAGGADRLELCSALAIGGLTPYHDLLAQIREESTIPVRCLMRPRAGDFLYTPEEIDLMARQMDTLARLGADGFVIGCLDARGNLDRAAMAPLIAAAGEKGLTLHRCIDVSRCPEQTLLDAGKMGIDTVLTSGAASGCMAGLNTIRKLLALSEATGGPQILVGAGVSAAVITHFRREIPLAQAFHMSGKVSVPSAMEFRREGIPMGIPGFDEWSLQQTSAAAVRAARAALDL